MNRRFFFQNLVNRKNRDGSKHTESISSNSEFPPIVNYYAESGLAGVDQYVVSGMLSMESSAAEQLELHVSSLRETHNYQPRLSYKSNNRYKIPLSNALILHFVNQLDGIFLAVKITEFSPDMISGELDMSLKLSNRAEAISILLAMFDQEGSGGNNSDPNGVVMKTESPFDPSDNYKTTISAETGNVFTVADSRDSQILQLLNLLVGTIACDIRGGSESETKNIILQILRGELGVDSLNPISLAGSSKIMFA